MTPFSSDDERDVRQPRERDLSEETRPSCIACGKRFSSRKWQCPSCGIWQFTSSSTEDDSDDSGEFETEESIRSPWKTTALHDVKESSNKRTTTGPWDEAFSEKGGVVSISLTLFAGDPGAGKSTIVLRILDELLRRDYARARYCYAEGASGIIRDYAARMKLRNMERIDMLPDFTPVHDVIDGIAFASGKCPFVVDSANALTERPDLVKKLCMSLKAYSLRNDAPAFLLSHINKKGDIAGIKALEHLVDTALILRTVKKKGIATDKRLLNVQKNRFGPNRTIQLRAVQDGFVRDDSTSEE